MNTTNGTKINNLLRSWPSNTVALSSGLEANGAYYSLIESYVKTKWLERLGSGAFIKSGDKVELTGAVYALQTQLKMFVHPAGKTALRLQGEAQYIPVESGLVSVDLFGVKGQKLPRWFVNHDWNQKYRYVMTDFLKDCNNLGFTKYNLVNYEITISSPERAALEYCYDYPLNTGFSELDHIISGLRRLRPEIVQVLLEKCTSVKTKRLFMYLAEKHKLPCVRYIELNKVSFGTGNRSLCKNGIYNAKYKIVVPEGEQVNDN